MQVIFHIDLNAFYASAEMANDSSLEGKPLVISGNNRRAMFLLLHMKQENMESILQCHYFKLNNYVKI